MNPCAGRVIDVLRDRVRRVPVAAAVVPQRAKRRRHVRRRGAGQRLLELIERHADILSPTRTAFHRLDNEFLDLWLDSEALALLPRPVFFVSPHVVQALLNLRVAAGEALDERSPARGERLRRRTRGLFAERGLDLLEQRVPFFRDALLQFRRPEVLALFYLRRRFGAVVLLRP